MGSNEEVTRRIRQLQRVAWAAGSQSGDHAGPAHWRWRPAPWSVALLGGVLAAVAIIAGAVHSAEPTAPTPSTPPVIASGSAVPAPSGWPQAGASASADNTRVVVHVVGQVASPGLVTLPAGARVADALERAGGPTQIADVTQVNLARPLSDGEQLRIPARGETPPAQASGAGTDAGAGGGASGCVNVNSADAGELDQLPGIGPALAERIVDHRATQGRFGSVDDLTQVSGIGEKTLQRFRDRVCV